MGVFPHEVGIFLGYPVDDVAWFHPIIVEIIVRLVGSGKFTVMLSMPRIFLQNISDAKKFI